MGALPGQDVADKVGVPTLAIDRSGGQFTGRLYFSWEDWESGKTVLRVIASPDAGTTWTKPTEIKPSSASENIFSGALAVNKDGAVALVYYQRGSPEHRGVWRAYFTTSTDGGRTFVPGVALSDEDENSWKPVGRGLPNDRFDYSGGDTVGLAATPDGLFHPFWVDSRIGSVQLWSTTVRVSTK